MDRTLDRSAILDEARRQFSRRGFKKTSLNDVVAALGVGKTAIYHHFPGGKGELVDACLKREEEVLFEALRAAVDCSQDPRLQLRAMLLTKAEQLRQLRDTYDISPSVGRELVELYQQHRRRFNQFEELLLKSIICRGQAMRLFRPTDAGRLAHALRVNFQHLEVPLVFEMRGERLAEHVDLILDLVLHGILSRAERQRRSPDSARQQLGPVRP